MMEYETALRNEPASALGRFSFCVPLSRRDRHSGAIEQCRAAVALAPDPVQILKGYTGIEAAGRGDEARGLRRRSGH